MRKTTRRTTKAQKPDGAAARAIWTGALSFGLVTVPVRLLPAVKEKQVEFHLLDRKEKVRLRRRLVRPTDDHEVPDEEQVRGFEMAPDQYVIVTDEELESLEPRKSRLIEIEDFVDLKEIDPIRFNRSYYLAPGEHGGKPYRLLAEAMSRTKRVGIGRFVMHNKEYLAALRPLDGVISLTTMHFADEILPASGAAPPEEVKLSDRELRMAVQLIEAMAGDFKPEQYHDTYREAVMKLVEQKAKGRQIVVPPPVEEKKGEIIDLMAKLEESLARKRKAG